MPFRGVAVEQILSGAIEPVAYDETDDELAIVLAGAAVLDVEGEHVELTASDWILLPAHTPHRLLHTEPGTSWLTGAASAHNCAHGSAIRPRQARRIRAVRRRGRRPAPARNRAVRS